jgi:Holliday junction resolvase-like predicted endonuclease
MMRHYAPAPLYFRPHKHNHRHMQKSTRHSKITGNFGEALILYWLSKRGFECADVDHTGIDLIARRPSSEEVLGISVKCRSRAEGTEASGVNLLELHDRKIESACRAFHCVPYFAIVVDQGSLVRGYLTSLRHARHQYAGQSWRMSPAMIQRYQSDPDIDYFELESHSGNWTAES